MTVFPPRCAARFKWERTLASGGFGSVHLARQVEFDRPVAIKLLLPGSLADSTAVDRFLGEARITASLSHPSIVKVIDHDVEGELPWIAYEYLPGASVQAMLESGPVPLETALDICSSVADALQTAHCAGVIHRDVKPDNVVSLGSAGWKLVDFGIARWDGSRQVMTATGVVVGTPTYLAPELLREGVEASVASDLYALGVMLHELVAGSPPFTGDTVVEVIRQHLEREPTPLTSLEPVTPPALERLVLQLLAKDPAARPPDAAAVGKVLEGLRGTQVSPPSGSGPVATPGARNHSSKSVLQTQRTRAQLVRPQLAQATRPILASPARRQVGSKALLATTLLVFGVVLGTAWRSRGDGVAVSAPTNGPQPAPTVATPSSPTDPIQDRLRDTYSSWYPHYHRRVSAFWKDRVLASASENLRLHHAVASSPSSAPDPGPELNRLLLNELRCRSESMYPARPTADSKTFVAGDYNAMQTDVEMAGSLIFELVGVDDPNVALEDNTHHFIQMCARNRRRLLESKYAAIALGQSITGLSDEERKNQARRITRSLARWKWLARESWVASMLRFEEVNYARTNWDRVFNPRSGAQRVPARAEWNAMLAQEQSAFKEAAERVLLYQRSHPEACAGDRGFRLWVRLKLHLAESQVRLGQVEAARSTLADAHASCEGSLYRRKVFDFCVEAFGSLNILVKDMHWRAEVPSPEATPVR